MTNARLLRCCIFCDDCRALDKPKIKIDKEFHMLKLHFAPQSRAGRILWLLEELQLPYELNAMAFHPKDLKSDEHRRGIRLGVLQFRPTAMYRFMSLVPSWSMYWPDI